MERLTMCIDSHLLDNGKLDKEYDLNNKIKLNEYSCMDVPNAVYNKLGELEDVLEKWHIEDLDKFIEEQITKKRELNDILWKMEQELAELKQTQKQLAISELGKLKSLLEKESKENPIVYDINNDLVGGAIDRDTCFYIINNQIKDLKGEENE